MPRALAQSKPAISAPILVCAQCDLSVAVSAFSRAGANSAYYKKHFYFMGWRRLRVYWSYLLGLLAMIKCSICSYQCDNWYVSNWRLACHMNVSLGSCCPELAQALSSVALAWHKARGSTPFGVTYIQRAPRHVYMPRPHAQTCHPLFALRLVSRRACLVRMLWRKVSSPVCIHCCRCCIHDGVATPLWFCKLTWLVLGEDPAACSHRVEQFTAL